MHDYFVAYELVDDANVVLWRGDGTFQTSGPITAAAGIQEVRRAVLMHVQSRDGQGRLPGHLLQEESVCITALTLLCCPCRASRKCK